MSDFGHVWKHYFPHEKSPEDYVEQYLIRLELFDKRKFEFWRDYQTHLAVQRARIVDEITDALDLASQENFTTTGYRVVTSNYGDDPLCTYGSIVDAGRFNFGSIASYENFDCLYLGDSPSTCYHEKFHLAIGEKAEGKLEGHEMALIPSHNTVRVNIQLKRYLDLRDKNSLHEFLKVVKKIKTPMDLRRRWEKIHKRQNEKASSINTIHALDQLIVSILDPNFKQLNALMDLPSNSQWLGSYAAEAGIQGIVYPSVRSSDGYNLAIFPSAIDGTDSEVTLVDTANYIPESRTSLNGQNSRFFRFTLAQLREMENELKT